MRAVLERDLLAEGARPRAFLVRGLVAAGSALMVLGGVLGSRGTSGYLEARTFERASWIALISLVLLTPVATVDAIVDERVRGTLPLVLSTPEGPRGFAAGKFLSRAGLAFGLFAATLPLLAVCWLCDGGSFARLPSLLSREGTLALPKSGRMRLPLHRRAWRLALSWNPLLAKDLVATKAIGTLLTLGVLGVLLAVVALFSVSGPGGMSRAAEVHITAVSRTVMA